MVACVGLVMVFQSSDNLAAAYGIAVVLTMIITTGLFFFTARRLWGWSAIMTGGLCGIFLVVELAFLGANLMKLGHGGAFPLAIGLLGLNAYVDLEDGARSIKAAFGQQPAAAYGLPEKRHGITPHASQRHRVFLAGNPDGTPLALIHSLKHNKVLHERVILLTLLVEEVPHVEKERRVEVTDLGNSFYRVIGRYGFMEEPWVKEILALGKLQGLKVREMESTFYLSRETVIASERPGFARWRKHLFALMSRNAQSATAFFRLPPNRVVEMGMQIEI